MQELILHLEDELIEEIKKICVYQGSIPTDVVTSALLDYIERHNRNVEFLEAYGTVEGLKLKQQEKQQISKFKQDKLDKFDPLWNG